MRKSYPALFLISVLTAGCQSNPKASLRAISSNPTLRQDENVRGQATKQDEEQRSELLLINAPMPDFGASMETQASIGSAPSSPRLQAQTPEGENTPALLGPKLQQNLHPSPMPEQRPEFGARSAKIETSALNESHIPRAQDDPPSAGKGLDAGIAAQLAPEPLKKLSALESSGIEFSHPSETPFIFDIPVTYNERVRQWIRYFQSEGRITFKNWLERSSRYLPVLQYQLSKAGLPQDLAYVAMIESGFSPNAASHAGAMGMWQFIIPTGIRMGLKVDWWIDERKDFLKATQGAIRYMRALYRQFGSWYLVAASYNMGENGVRRIIQRHKTNSYWELVERHALPLETSDYVPKIMAAMLISKAPALYGFRDLDYQMPLSFESLAVPGGTDIINLATYLGVSEKYLKDLNPELIKGFVPTNVRAHKIRVPKGSTLAVSQFIRLQASNELGRASTN